MHLIEIYFTESHFIENPLLSTTFFYVTSAYLHQELRWVYLPVLSVLDCPDSCICSAILQNSMHALFRYRVDDFPDLFEKVISKIELLIIVES